jgi:phosphoribosyl-AMP cyclohydrolase
MMRGNKSSIELDFVKRKGLVPVIVQDLKTKDVLMLAYANKEALKNTIETGKAWFWSTSGRQRANGRKRR